MFQSKKIVKLIISSFMIFSFLSLVACSHQPTLGEKMVEQSAETRKMGKNWMEGKKEVEKGEALIKNGEQLVKKGKTEIQEGRKLVKRGNKHMKKSEIDFKEKFPEISLEQQ